jgi:hypothetical protein
MSRLSDIKSIQSNIAGGGLKAPATESPEGDSRLVASESDGAVFLEQAERCRRLAHADANLRDRFLKFADGYALWPRGKPHAGRARTTTPLPGVSAWGAVTRL